MSDSNIRLGDKVRDRISGMEGIVVGYSTWLFGCERVALQPKDIKDGRPVDLVHIDAAQCELIERDAVPGYKPATAAAAADVRQRPAGPREDATRGHEAARR